MALKHVGKELMPGRQKVDTQLTVPLKDLEVPFVTLHPQAGG